MHREHERFTDEWQAGGRFRHGPGDEPPFGRHGGRGGRRGDPPFGGPGPFGGRALFFRHWGGGRRARRGDIRAALLALLAEKPMHGYDLMRELNERSGGLWNPSPGSVYPTLQMLEEEGRVTGEEVEGRRTFSLTDEGRAEHEAHMKRTGGAPPWQERDGAHGELVELREAAFQLGAAVMQIARLSSPAQIAEALAIVKDARRRLYRLLADAP